MEKKISIILSVGIGQPELSFHNMPRDLFYGMAKLLGTDARALKDLYPDGTCYVFYTDVGGNTIKGFYTEPHKEI